MSRDVTVVQVQVGLLEPAHASAQRRMLGGSTELSGCGRVAVAHQGTECQSRIPFDKVTDMSLPGACDTQDLIWHYTTAAGLQGILEKEVIYATDALYLNDARELEEALDVQRQGLRDATAPVELGQPITTVAALYAMLVSPHIEDLGPMEGIFIASFCREGDLLSQWRGYAGARGYSIGISRSGLAASASEQGDVLAEVIYGAPPEEVSARLKSPMLMVGSGRSTAKSDSEVVARLKSEAFREEQELRLIAERGDRALRFRDGVSGFVPYIELPLSRSLIQQINVGPGFPDERAVRAVERLAGALGTSLTVARSAVPFRG